WAVHYTMQELTDELVKRGRNIGDVTSVQITARHPEGTVAEVTFVGTMGIARYSKSTLLSVLGLKSFVFAMGAEQFVWSKDGQAVVTDAEVYIQGAEDSRSETETVCVIGADGEVTELEPGELRISNGQTVASPEGMRSAGWTDDPVESSVVYIAGSGWGHGVGMPQTSARNMANEGYTCEDILEYYYEGTEIDDLENFR
ncbi:MAG: hypothetical protein K5981_03520, partial [Clostridia bacterium]|nr:hypothetical protein [Clostridia bacterium]